MVIDRKSFFIALGSLAVGAAGGYVVSERGVLRPPATLGMTEQQSPAPIAPAVAAPIAATESPVLAPPAPACDDTVGAAANCPGPGSPSEEGGCGLLPAKRCEDFKQAMKPRVAERAVACLNTLDTSQRCDSKRLNLCGHLALMNACPEPEVSAASSGPATDGLTVRCTSIEETCGATAAFRPTLRDCRATLAGLSEFGRDQMASCMKTHCADRGLIGCEAVLDAK